MPLFFLVAGFFLKYELSTKEFATKDFKRLIIPYFIFAIIALMLETIKKIALNREGLDYLYELQGIFIWMDYPSLINSYGFVLWFLPALFFSRLIIFSINKYVSSLLIQSAIILLLFSFSFSSNIILGIDNALNAVIFVFLGSIFYRFHQNDKRLYILPFVLIGLIIFFGIPSLDMASKSYENVMVNILYAISIIFVIIYFLKKINYRSELVSIWARNTMLLFIIHPYTNNISDFIVNKLHFGDWYLKFLISLILLQGALSMKRKFINRGIFKYV